MNATILNRGPQLPADRWHQIEAPREQQPSNGRVQVIDTRAAGVAVEPPAACALGPEGDGSADLNDDGFKLGAACSGAAGTSSQGVHEPDSAEPPEVRIKNAANQARPMDEPPAVTSLTVTRAWLRSELIP